MAPGAIGAVSSAAEGMIEEARGSVVEVASGRRGAGAGVLWPGGALVLTNDHVVSAGGPGRRRGRGRGTHPRVTLRDGRVFDAEVAKRDGRLDLALLRLKDAPVDLLLPAAVGDSGALRVGELVFAVGHPWGRPGVATVGIVSGLAREGGARHIVSDVSLAPGNSGGPLLNASGEVVGINVMVSGGFAFSIPSDVASAWVTASGTGRPRLGVGVVPAGVRGDAGLAVAFVEGGGPADGAGVIVGDVLLGMEGDSATLGSSGDLSDALVRTGETVRLRVLRGGEELVVSVDLKASGRAA